MLSPKLKMEDMKVHPGDDTILKTSRTQETMHVDHLNPLSQFKQIHWKQIKVGDIILLRNNDRIPADVVIIASSELDSTCYIETKNLDGETNLKIKRGIKELGHVRSPADCRKLKCHIDAEAPNNNLYTFSGTFTFQDEEAGHAFNTIPIGPSSLLLRGCVIRNTSWVIGVALYTGSDTKIMLNAGPTPSKRSKIDKQITPQVCL
jgi:phospholipid-translocating ATPase